MQAAVARTPTLEARPSPLRVALVVALAHGVTDAYPSLVPPLLPRIMDELGLSVALAATLGVTFPIAGALPQPLLGYLADRHGRRVWAILAPLTAGVFAVSVSEGKGGGARYSVFAFGGARALDRTAVPAPGVR